MIVPVVFVNRQDWQGNGFDWGCPGNDTRTNARHPRETGKNWLNIQ